MITIAYILIVGYVLALVLWNLYTEKRALDQITAALVLIPLMLRLFGIK